MAALDAETICRLRTAIADQLLNNELIADSKNPYLRHLKAVRESGCENAYNHYVVLYGDQPAFKRWVALHPIEWQRFADWFDSTILPMASAPISDSAEQTRHKLQQILPPVAP